MNEKRFYYCSVYGDSPETFYNIDDRFIVDIGYGLEPSYIFYFKEKGIVQKGIDIWDSYFYSIVENIQLKDSVMTGLIYYVNIGEFENDCWHINDTDLIYRQLQSVNISALHAEGDDFVNAYNALLEFVKEMVDSNNSFYVMKL